MPDSSLREFLKIPPTNIRQCPIESYFRFLCGENYKTITLENTGKLNNKQVFGIIGQKILTDPIYLKRRVKNPKEDPYNLLYRISQYSSNAS